MQYCTETVLKDGTVCLLRSAAGEDAEEVLRVFNLTHGQTEYLLTYPEESSFTPEEERKFLEKQADSANAVEICAFVDGRLAGNAGIEPVGGRIKVKHRAEFGIAIDRAYWGRGIGRALTLACLECAREAGFTQVELNAVAENEGALALYRSVGFVEFGRNPKGFRTRDGRWQELVYMRLEL